MVLAIPGPHRVCPSRHKSGAGHLIPTPPEATHTMPPLKSTGKKGIMGPWRSNLLCGRYALLHRGAGDWYSPAPCLLLLCLSGPFYNRTGKIAIVIDMVSTRFGVLGHVCFFPLCCPDKTIGTAQAVPFPQGAAAQPTDRAPPSGGKPDMRSMGGAVRAPESPRRGSQGWPGAQRRVSGVGYADHTGIKRSFSPCATAPYALFPVLAGRSDIRSRPCQRSLIFQRS